VTTRVPLTRTKATVGVATIADGIEDINLAEFLAVHNGDVVRSYLCLILDKIEM
jgi:hypothetical protein